MDYHVAKKNAQQSSKKSTLTGCLSCEQESSQVTTLSNNIGERIMELSNGNPVVQWLT